MATWTVELERGLVFERYHRYLPSGQYFVGTNDKAVVLKYPQFWFRMGRKDF